ncbi:hypothetical protein J5X98_24455 [Leptothermofonsia sichuanensis E412]|uniref:hypothetical protein n=1 Tax=Leptothermofonsia sichuanensis TaxID=2917832 RepID=UPI001CA766D9|nr:hypothetical protein [Leptothermofonsia sichuanensis]QZZ20369.1 hypothetical protein J5X98_24455 [Leptothermofonsia sichuanensis E412]
MNLTNPPLLKICLATAVSTVLMPFSDMSNAQQVAPCRQLGRDNTVVIIEASNNERMQLVNQVVSERNLKGQFCASRRTGRMVWMSDQISSVELAVKVFDYFRAVGLVSPVNLNGNGNEVPSPYPAFPDNQTPNPAPNGRGVRI